MVEAYETEQVNIREPGTYVLPVTAASEDDQVRGKSFPSMTFWYDTLKGKNCQRLAFLVGFT